MSRHSEFRAGSMLELRWKIKRIRHLSKEQINEHAQTLISIKIYCIYELKINEGVYLTNLNHIHAIIHLY
jgi:hypothetical protein